MVKYKDSVARVTLGSRNIVVDGVRIEDGKLVDEMGDIASALANTLPEGVEEFTIKIKIELPEEE
jgi:hypothetical protein